MALTLDNLKSRTIRNLIGNGRENRKIFTKPNTQSKTDGNLLEIIWSTAKGFGNFLFQVGKWLIDFIGFSWTTLWSIIVGAATFLWNFNWNASDESYMKMIQQGFERLGGNLGGFLGNALGWIACGILPGVVIAKFNPALGAAILKEVGEEALDEIAGNLAILLKQIFTLTLTSGLAYAYVNLRKLWRDPDDKFVKKLKASGKFSDKEINDKLAERNKPWSIAKAVEEKIESIPWPFLKEFVEEFLEEAQEACVEAGYAVASGADAFYAMQRLANENILGQTQAVEIVFDRSDDDKE